MIPVRQLTSFNSVARTLRSGVVFQILFPIVALAIVLPLGLYSILLAAGFAFLLITLTLAAVLGLERTGALFLLAAITAAPLNDLRPVPGLSFVTLADALFGIGFLILIPHLAGTPLQLPAPFVVGVAGVLAAGALASMASSDPALSFNHMLRFGVGALALATLLTWWRPRMKVVVAAAAGYVLGNCISVAAAVTNGTTYAGRHIGLSTHPNIMGLCDALAISLVPFLLYSVRREHRWMVWAGAAICAYGIWINGSRGALLTSLAILVLYPAITRSTIAGLGVVAAGFVMPVLVTQLADRVSDASALGRLLGRGNSEGANLEREEAARVAIDQFLNRPLLGGGFGPILEAHNIYLQILAAIGIFGLVFYLLVLGSLVRPLFVGVEPYRLLSVPALAYAMAGLVFPLLWDRYIWCVLALALVGPILAREAEPDHHLEKESV